MKALAISLAVLIVILIGILIFVPRAEGPNGSSGSTVSSDGHLSLSIPHPGSAIASPVAIEGNVTGGGWFFEATFPVFVVDANGRVLGEGTANALSDWMSSGTVPFSASIPFTTPSYATGTIVLRNDNPSGSSDNLKSLSIPVTFTAPSK